MLVGQVFRNYKTAAFLTLSGSKQYYSRMLFFFIGRLYKKTEIAAINIPIQITRLGGSSGIQMHTIQVGQLKSAFLSVLDKIRNN